MSTAGIVLALIAILLSGGCVDSSLEKELQAQQDHYCDMVRLYVESDGKYGWFDYKQIYEGHC